MLLILTFLFICLKVKLLLFYLKAPPRNVKIAEEFFCFCFLGIFSRISAQSKVVSTK